MRVFETIFIICYIFIELNAVDLDGTAKNIISGTGNFGNVQISTDLKGMVSQIFTEIRKDVHTGKTGTVQSSKAVDPTDKTSPHKVQHTKEVHGINKKSSSDPVDESTNKFLQSLFV
ncbi:hypothetical protein FF38_13604 [Lucilia cuprina]|uniref:Uncharacterized protein n=1 Tax=Lucilia cuprina TaxID=7375 RepID=A0A0L0CA68_LUCCU|nr:hypothetical protein CVS40_12290 [Lucilia cuprina]KNC29141.1 hypothetical protein FF38_13604 [Lucilia cuprina]